MRSGWKDSRTNSPEETMRLGQNFAALIEPGDVFALHGELAAGKTTFMKGVAQGLQWKGSVTSPTFTLVNEYDSNPRIIHIDAYRESDPQRWLRLGLREYFSGDHVVFIEWAELIEALLPPDTIHIRISEKDESQREFHIR